MSDYRRLRIPGATYFFTVALADRSSDLLIRRITDFRRAVVLTMQARPFHCDAAVVLPDHLHMVWTLPEGDADFSTRWGAIKARFTMSLRRSGFSPALSLPVVKNGRFAGLKPGLRHDKREQAVWQRRFCEHRIRDEADFRAHVTYCWGNPVKHGLVTRAADWPHSSIHRDMRDSRVPPEWVGEICDGGFGEP